MSYPSMQQPRLDYLEPGHASNERSAYIYAVEYCTRYVPESSEIKELTAHPWSLRSSLFWLGTDAGPALGQAIGLDSKVWARASGRDIVGIHAARSVLLGELRHCPVCLAQGWHSALYQHAAVQKCPIHQVQLATGCLHCGSAISTSMTGIAKNHFHCATCGKSLASQRRRAGIGKPIVQVSARHFAALRESLLDSGASDVIRSPLTLDRSPEESVRLPGAPRDLAHHLQWPGGASLPNGPQVDRHDQQITIREETASIPPGQQQRRLRAAALETVEEIMAAAQQAGAGVEIPEGLWTVERGAARVDVAVDMVAAALWRTAHAFEVSAYLLGELPPPAAGEQPFSRDVPPYEGIDSPIRAAQVAGVFVESILRLRRLQYGVQIDWSAPASTTSFMPAWRGTVQGGDLVLRLRSRCNLILAARLARRYRSKGLAAAPAGTSPHALVAEAGAVGLAAASSTPSIG